VRLFLAIAMLALPLGQLDDTVQREIQGLRRPVLERPMHTISNLGKPVVVFGVLLAIAIFDGAHGVLTARTALLALAPTNLVVETLKRAVNRTRPDGEHKRSNASFPSSHSANAFALAWVLARRWKRLAPLFWISASTVAISRLYLNRHYLSDVVVGALIGILSAWLVMRWMKGRRRRPRAAAAA